ncbi:efflux transporter outer membrane subunit [Chromobacterium subtsugae]|uniref:efflux transporter outer membrane subunit n=1 Tax=Chromobacterium subtsugae TaxID=251747 RepID=UPI0006411E7D|nr:efflux transporter outer membrane subunit [Chromobacterium subtsugae]
MNKKLWLTTLCASLLLAGCASDHGLAPQARPLAAETLKLGAASAAAAVAEQAAWPEAAWWGRFQDAQLSDLIQRALSASPTMIQAQARLERAGAFLAGQSAAEGPQLDLNGVASRHRFSAHGAFPAPLAGSSYNSVELGLDFHYEFDFWGRNRERTLSELNRRDAARLEAQAVGLALASSVSQSYVELARLEQQKALAEQRVQLREREAALRESRLKAGLDSDVELKQSGASVSMARADVEALGNQAVLLRHRLAVLAGMDPAAGEALARPTLKMGGELRLPARLESDLLARRPEVAAQKLRLEAASHDIQAAKADFYPNIDLMAGVGGDALNASDLFKGGSQIFNLGPAIHLPLFDAGRLRAGLALRNADYDAEVALYNQLVLDALRDVADQVGNWRSLANRQGQHEAALRQLESADQAAQSRYRKGLSSYLAVIGAEDRLLAQKAADIDLQALRLQTAIRLNHALGGGLDLSLAESKQA